MAFIGTLREKMGFWVVIFVFVAIASFILADLFTGKTSSIFNSGNDVGEINGHSITIEEFQAAVNEREASYVMNFNRQPTDREMPTLRQQAWELLILRYAIQPEYSKVGVAVTSDEVADMINGKNIDENVRQAFTDPQTGQFDRNRLTQYISQILTMPENSEPRVRWEMFQRDLQPGRERLKYENLLVKTDYVTTAEAEREYHLQTDVAEVKYLYIPFYADTTTAVSDADFNDYYNKNKEKFKTEDSRSLLYATFPLVASSADSADIKKDAERIAVEFATATEDSVYAAGATQGASPYERYMPSSLPQFLTSADLQQGKVIGPFIDGDSYKVVKISKVSRDTIFNTRARHILIKPTEPVTDASKAEAREKARKILKEIKGGADFAAKAREFGTDGTATRGGDLGWFSTGQMVKPFEKAVFGATKPGLLNDVVETDFGFHIIDVTNVKDNLAYYVATVELPIAPSDETTNEAYRKAEAFATDLSGVAEFKAKAAKEGIPTTEANDVLSSDRRVGNLGESREIVLWLYNTAEEGKVSDVFDLQDNYVIAVMTGGVEKGYKPLSAVKEEIRPMVQNQVRGKAIIAKLGDAKGTLEETAAAFGNNANVYSSSDVKLSGNALPTAGFDPSAIGLAFSLENGQRSKPFIGETGVIVMELQNKTIAPEIADYTSYKNQLQQNASQRSTFNIGEAIKSNANIVDKRYKFY